MARIAIRIICAAQRTGQDALGHRPLMHMRVMTKMAYLVDLLVHAIPRCSAPGELERQEYDKENDKVTAHGESVQRYMFRN